MKKSMSNEAVTLKKQGAFDFKTIFPFLGLAAVILFFQLYSRGRVLTQQNLIAVLNECFFIIVGATGISFIMAEGNLDFSIGATMGLCCAIAARVSNINPYLAIVAPILPGMAIGLINGLVHVKLKVGSLIGTLAMQFVITGVLVMVTAGQDLAAPIGILSWNTMALKLLTIVSIAGLGYVVFHFTAYGKNCRAIGSCEEAARQSGVNVQRTKVVSFITMGALAGLLAFFSLIRTASSTALTGGELTMNVLCAALLGGLPLHGGAAAKFRAVIIGSLTMAFLKNGMVLMGLKSYDMQLVQGIVFLITIAISTDRRNMRLIK